MKLSRKQGYSMRNERDDFYDNSSKVGEWCYTSWR
jgi:hypothetical protein